MTISNKSVDYPEDLISFLTEQLMTARREIRIYSQTLVPTVFADSEVVEKLSAAVRASRQCQARIVVSDAKALSASQHPLLKLSRTLPSLIKIREHQARPERYERHYCLLDRSHYLAWDDEHDAAIALDESAACKERVDYFDQLWEHSIDHPELRTLTL
jgi:hypothetical protein